MEQKKLRLVEEINRDAELKRTRAFIASLKKDPDPLRLKALSIQEFQRKSYEKGLKCQVPNWVYNREVRIHPMPDIRTEVAQYIVKGLQDFVAHVGLDFLVRNMGNRSELVRRLSLVSDPLNSVFRVGSKNTDGSPKYVEVVAFNTLSPKKPDDWGWGYFEQGVIQLALYQERQRNLDFIRNVSKHEASHLFLESALHHDCQDATIGYQEVTSCNRLWEAPTSQLCQKCTDEIIYFWKGVEDQTNQRFLT